MRRTAAQQTFLRLADEGRLEEATAIGEQVLAMTTELYGAEGVERVRPLTNLGTIQLRRGNDAAAEQHFREAIDVAERAAGIGSERLVKPLIGLGDALARRQQFSDAALAFERALTLSHAANGFYDSDQLRVLDGLSEVQLGLDNLERANDYQEAQLGIAERHAAEDPDGPIEARMKLGRWYNRTGQPLLARSAFQSARSSIRRLKGKDHPDSVDALLGEAESYRREAALPAASVTLRRALTILDAQAVRDHLKRAEVLLASGDLNISAQFASSAQKAYEAAWVELSGDSALQATREEWFSRPVRIAGPNLARVVNEEGVPIERRSTTASGTQPGQVSASFTVTAAGRAADIVILESDPPGLMDKSMRRLLAFSVWRPRLVDGKIVATENHLLQHEFRYPRPAPAPTTDEGPDAGETGGRIANPTEAGEP